MHRSHSYVGIIFDGSFESPHGGAGLGALGILAFLPPPGSFKILSFCTSGNLGRTENHDNLDNDDKCWAAKTPRTSPHAPILGGLTAKHGGR